MKLKIIQIIIIMIMMTMTEEKEKYVIPCLKLYLLPSRCWLVSCYYCCNWVHMSCWWDSFQSTSTAVSCLNSFLPNYSLHPTPFPSQLESLPPLEVFSLFLSSFFFSLFCVVFRHRGPPEPVD